MCGVRGLARVNPDATAAREAFTGGMLKVIGIAALVIIAVAVLGWVAKAVLWIALIAALVVIGGAAYKVIANKRKRDAIR
ncbi:hypothetical protein [Pseudonocardia acaciae]|uniref:hypothetical protein n=1 Tax=Pseudonocardia acaciae TaxID=551276 RepID=UPI000A8A6E61|nr:hypothetical protein [Pseudonocardia acaciae]